MYLCALGGAFAVPQVAAAGVVQAQQSVQGAVVDDLGEPLMGATVTVKGTSNGTVTDLDGNFSLNAPAGSTLVISYVGFTNKEVKVSGDGKLGTITLLPDDKTLEQVVVVGYGTQKKADLTGSVAIVNADQMKKTSNSNISTLLEGKVAGVSVTSDGQPGADPAVRIRGLGSFNSTAPLYVIDGVPLGTSIRDFSANDIETIQILKDASAAAVYGSRAANGVVIITTKRGAKDQPVKIDYNGYVGFDNVSSSVFDTMNADEYSNYLGQACANSNTTLPGGYSLGSDGKYHFTNYDGEATDTDWFDVMFKTGVRTNHNVNISGGGKTNTYNVGLDYYMQNGTVEGAGPSYNRYTARVNNSFDVKFIKVKTGVVYSHSTQDGLGLSNASEYVQGLYGDVQNVLASSLLMQPTIKAYDENTWVLDDQVGAASSYNYDAYGYGVYYDDIHGDISASNPLLVNNLIQRTTIVDRVVATASADVDLLDMIGVKSENHKLHYNLNLSYSKTYCKDEYFAGSWIQSNRVYLAKSNERLSKTRRDYTDALVENYITYDGTFGKHHLNLMAGTTYEKELTNTVTAWATDLNEPYYLQLQNSSSRDATSYDYTHVLNSYMGRINYDYDGKYLLQFTVRRDGTSRVSDHWGTFPAGSIGWRFDKEKFFPFSRDVVNMFKVRASYGKLGDENIGDYAYLATMSRNNMAYSFNGNKVTGSSITTFVNEDLKWEEREMFNVGIDLAMFNNRLEFTAEYYKNKSNDLLYSVPVPASAGVQNETVTMNAASMENSGMEFSATYRNRDHKLKWEISANLSTLKNKVTSLGFGSDCYITGAYATYVGREVGEFYGYIYEGIARTQSDLDNHATQNGANVGDCLYKDVNGDGLIDANDQVVLESGMPHINFGLSARLEYGNFDLSIATFGALDYHVSDYLWNSLHSSYGYSNKSTDLNDANRWSEDGSTYLSSVPRTYATNNAEMAWNDLFSSRYIQNAAYWKINNIELGYNMPNKWFNGVISNVRVYVSVQNLATITGYEGYNVDYAGGTFTPGYNYCSYPTPKTFMMGLHMTF